MANDDVVSPSKLTERTDGRVVDRSSAERSTKDDDVVLVLTQAESLSGGGPARFIILCDVEDRRSNRVPRPGSAGQVGAFVGDGARPSELPDEFVRQARYGVLFRDHDGNPAQNRPQAGRDACVSAQGDHDIGMHRIE